MPDVEEREEMTDSHSGTIITENDDNWIKHPSLEMPFYTSDPIEGTSK